MSNSCADFSWIISKLRGHEQIEHLRSKMADALEAFAQTIGEPVAVPARMMSSDALAHGYSGEHAITFAYGWNACLNSSHAHAAPSPKSPDDYEQDEYGHIDTYCTGHMDGWNACRAAMLALTTQPRRRDVNDETMREAFEKWANDEGFYMKRTLDGENYHDLRTQGPWEAWQAAWNIVARAPDGGESVGEIVDRFEASHSRVVMFTENLAPGTKLFTRSNAKAGEVEKDATRYRFIKSAPAGTVRADFHSFLPAYYHWGNGQSLDEAIDAALSTQRGDGSEMGSES